jgi:glycosyltransferase involved in cell wall biosynthesis
MNAEPGVALAHDYLTQRGGAERVALMLTKAFPGAPMYTSLYEPKQTFEQFRDVDVRTSFLQAIGPLRADPRRALPLLAAAWGRLHVRDADVVVSSSSGWAHGVGSSSECIRVVYCHNPARWLYQSDEYATGVLDGLAISALRSPLRFWDQRAAARADVYVANSTVVAERIRRIYGVEPLVVYPPVAVDIDGLQDPVPGMRPGFWLTIGRGRGYKNTAAVAQAVAGLRDGELAVVGSTAEMLGDAARLPGVRCLGIVTDNQLRWLYANARALVSVSSEDFGLTPIEANAFGTPVAVLRGGGFLDSTVEGVSGTFIDDDRPSTISSVLRSFPTFDREVVSAHALKFNVQQFVDRIRGIVYDARRNG